MKIRALMLAALLVAAPAAAWAKGLVLWDADAAGSAQFPVVRAVRSQEQRMRSAVLDVLDMFGADYRIAPISATKTVGGYARATEWLRTGDMHWNAGTAGETVEHFDWIIFVGWKGRIASSDGYFPWSSGICYPCSLTSYTKYPKVPVLMLYGAAFTRDGSLYGNSTATAGACSTGVSGATNGGACPTLNYVPGDPSMTWFSSSNQAQILLNGSTGNGPVVGVSAGGVRKLLATSAGNFAREGWSGVPCVNCDSIPWPRTADTLQVWERPFSTIADAKPIVFANIMGVSPCGDSTNVEGNEQPCEFDGPTLMIALARLDSLAAGDVFARKAAKVVAITVDGAFEHTTARWGIEGVYLPDSADVKANLRDSCMTYGIPLTLAVDPTKFSSYPNEVAWYDMPMARYSPQVWLGVKDSTAASGACDTTGTGVVDVFGRYRNRTYYALPSHTAGDTSLYANLIHVRGAVASVYGRSRLSSTILAPWDDYSPKNIRNGSNGLDSLVMAITRAGFTTIRTDVQNPEANPAYLQPNRDLIRGGFPNQRKYTSPLGASVTFVGQTGYSTSGGNKFWATRNDSTSIPRMYTFGIGLSYPTITHANLGRFWGGFFHETWRDVDWFPRASLGDGVTDGGYVGDSYANVLFPLNDNLYDQHRASVLKMHVSDFTGKRPGWWTVKSLKREIDYINRLAGRTVIRLGYPEEIVP